MISALLSDSCDVRVVQGSNVISQGSTVEAISSIGKFDWSVMLDHPEGDYVTTRYEKSDSLTVEAAGQQDVWIIVEDYETGATVHVTTSRLLTGLTKHPNVPSVHYGGQMG